jgi:hypothetical protein
MNIVKPKLKPIQTLYEIYTIVLYIYITFIFFLIQYNILNVE